MKDGYTMSEGILLAGNMIEDVVKIIETYPQKMALTPIKEVRHSFGGAVCNCGVDLASLDPSLPITVVSAVGDDEAGHRIMDKMAQYENIDLQRVMFKGKTSFTDVMTEQKSGQRTFFTFKGADNLLVPEDFDFTSLPGSLFHIGYIMLLNGLDAPDATFGTAMARVLHDAQQHGKRTSIDIVTEQGNRYKSLVPPALTYTDYCCINESEAQAVTDVPLRNADGALLREHFPEACLALKAMGVSTWAIIHAPEYVAGVDENGAFFSYESIPLPEGYIKGSVGAGDAFVSGVLYSAYRNESLQNAIWLGSAIAVISLSAPGATQSVSTLQSVIETYQTLEQRQGR